MDLGAWRGPDELTRLDEKSLVLSSQDGDARAIDSIYQRYSPLVYSICLRMLRDPHDAQEATQETFLRVFRALPKFNGSYRLKPWICRIARNICLDKARFATTRTNVSESVDPMVQESTPDPSTEPERVLMRKFEGSRLRAHLDDLPPQYKSVLLLRDLDGLSYADIAEKLSISESQVKNFLHRARKKLRQSLVIKRTALLAPIGFLKLGWYRLFRTRSATTAVAPQEGFSPSLMGAVASSTPQLTSASQAIVAACQPAGERIVAAVGAAVVGFGLAGAPTTALTPKLERPAVHVVEHSARPEAPTEYFNPPVPDQSSNEDERDASVATGDAAAELESQQSTTEPVASEEEGASVPDEEVPAAEEETASESPSEPIVVVAEVPTETPAEAPVETGSEEPVEAPVETGSEEPVETPVETGSTEAPVETGSEEPTEAPVETGSTEAPAETGSEEITEAPADDAVTDDAPEVAGDGV